MEKFELKIKDPKIPNNIFYKIGNGKYIPEPLDVPSKDGTKKLWEERLEECRKTNPGCTFEDMCWGIADIPDEFIIEGDHKFKKHG